VAKRDYYEVLEVAKAASTDEIKKAYRKKALQHHPDRNPGDKSAEEKFKEATEAYSVLSEPEKRQQYDQFGHQAFEGNAGGFGGFGDFSGFEDIFEDIFGAFFGGASGGSRRGGRSSRVRPGRDLKYDLEITLEESAFGGEREITLPRRQPCAACTGTGCKPGTAPETCSECHGQGQVRMQQGFFTLSRPCGSCGGVGQRIAQPCASCRGGGFEEKTSKLGVKIPPGIDHGQRLRLRGEGESGAGGGPAGDLYVQIFIKKHDIFARQESELVCELPVLYAEAVLGAEVEVPTLEGKTKLKIPAGTQSGKIFRMKNLGLPVLGSNRRGDLHARVSVRVPKKVSEEERKLLEQLLAIQRVKDTEKSFFDRMKELFQPG